MMVSACAAEPGPVVDGTADLDEEIALAAAANPGDPPDPAARFAPPVERR